MTKAEEAVTDTRHRRKQLQISEELFILLFSEGIHNPVKVIKDPVPADARIVGARYDGFTNVATFLLESAQFPELEEGAEYPNLTPLLENMKQDCEERLQEIGALAKEGSETSIHEVERITLRHIARLAKGEQG